MKLPFSQANTPKKKKRPKNMPEPQEYYIREEDIGLSTNPSKITILKLSGEQALHFITVSSAQVPVCYIGKCSINKILEE